jgi:hypothetical protein
VSGVVDRPAVDLRRTRHVISRLGAPLDFQGIDADFEQPLHMFDGA